MFKVTAEPGEMKLINKILSVVIIVLAIVVIILSLLDIFDILNGTIKMYEPLISVILLCQAYNMRKTAKTAAIISLCCAVFILIVSVIIIFF